jgi:hypothetical protein
MEARVPSFAVVVTSIILSACVGDLAGARAVDGSVPTDDSADDALRRWRRPRYIDAQASLDAGPPSVPTSDAGVAFPSPVDSGVDAGSAAVSDSGTPPSSATRVTARFAPTTATIPNPERGFYGWAGSDAITSFDESSIVGARDSGQRLVLLKVTLASYRTSDIAASFLTTLRARLARVRELGMKVTIWFAYDWSAGGDDTTAEWIERHLEQLGPVLRENVDVIAHMRAGFIGAWGEWHSSRHGNSSGYLSGSTTVEEANANRLQVRDALLAHVPAEIIPAYRYPRDLMRWFPEPVDAAEAFTSSPAARAGFHNDCFLAGENDTGTYSGATGATTSRR